MKGYAHSRRRPARPHGRSENLELKLLGHVDRPPDYRSPLRPHDETVAPHRDPNRCRQLDHQQSSSVRLTPYLSSLLRSRGTATANTGIASALTGVLGPQKTVLAHSHTGRFQLWLTSALRSATLSTTGLTGQWAPALTGQEELWDWRPQSAYTMCSDRVSPRSSCRSLRALENDR